MCLHCGGVPPYGFKLNDNKMLEIDEATAPVVRKIYQMYLADMGYKAILQWLDENGYTTQRGNKFSKTAVNAILHNEKYSGVYVYDRTTPKDENGKRNSHKIKDSYVRIEGGCPAIITPEEFQKVQEKMKNHSNVKLNYSTKHYYPLTGKLWNDTESSRYSGNVNHSNGKKYYQYKCCESGYKAVSAESLEESVFFALRKLLISEDKEEQLLEALNQYSAEIQAEAHDDYRYIKQKQTALQNKLSNLVALSESGKAPVTILNHITELENEISSLERQLEMIDEEPHIFTSDELKKIKKQFISYMQTHNNLEAKNLINAAVNKILIGDEMIEIKFENGIAVTNETADFFNH